MRAKQIVILLQAGVLLFAISCNRLSKPDDNATTTDIKAKMFSDPSLKTANVAVAAHNGEVTLSGQVPDDSARLAAYKIATESKGVSKVNDQMTVQPPSAATQPASNPLPEPAAATNPAEKVRSERKPTSHKPNKSPSTDAGAADAASAGAPTAASEKPVSPALTPPPQPRTVTVPAGSVITVRMIDGVDSSVNTAGQVFKASLDAPIVVGDRVVVPKGADVYVKLVNASSAGKFKGRSELTLDIQSIIFQGRTYNVSTSDVKQSGASRGKRSAATIGGGAALGALIGGLVGGGKGAAVGAAVGGGAGTGVQVFTKGQQIKIPSETRLDFTLEQPFDITYFPQKRSRQAASASSTDRPSPN
jgi:outer membrane lipoprotein SlyB